MMEYDNIREVIGEVIGTQVIDITQDDWDDVVAASPDPDERQSYVHLHLSNGKTLSFAILGNACFVYELEDDDDIHEKSSE